MLRSVQIRALYAYIGRDREEKGVNIPTFECDYVFVLFLLFSCYPWSIERL